MRCRVVREEDESKKEKREDTIQTVKSVKKYTGRDAMLTKLSRQFVGESLLPSLFYGNTKLFARR